MHDLQPTKGHGNEVSLKEDPSWRIRVQIEDRKSVPLLPDLPLVVIVSRGEEKGGEMAE
jgi:hypothetical protein